jgi:hypothetical protein
MSGDDVIDLLRLRAERCAQSGLAQPIVGTPEEALALGARIAAQLAALPNSERLLFLAYLDQISSTLQGRLERLAEEMAASGERLTAAQRQGAGCRAYATVAALPRRRPRPG